MSSPSAEASNGDADVVAIISPPKLTRALPTSSSSSSSTSRLPTKEPSRFARDVVDCFFRPMLTTRSLTEELQGYICLDDAEFRAFDRSTLSPYALYKLRVTGFSSTTRGRYLALCGWVWQATSFQQRCDATTRLLHDEAVHGELDLFTAWLKGEAERTAGLVSGQEEVEDVGCWHPTYWRYRLRHCAPISWLAHWEVDALCRAGLVDSLLASRAGASGAEKSRSANEEVTDAEGEQPAAKRRRSR